MHKPNVRSTPEHAGFHRKALVLLLGLALAQNTLAGEEHVQVLGEIRVTGQAASTDSALDVQQMADHIVSVVHADAIGQLPDSNAAEALQRVPGVSLERDQGEGRYVRVRGLGPDLNTVTINGSLVPAPESDRRAVALDVLPAGLIRALEVRKTLTPEMDAGSLGGTIEVKTISAFDQKDDFHSLEGGVGHDTHTGENNPNFAAAWSKRFLDGKLGIAVGLSTQKRKFGSDNSETGGAWDGDKLEEFERRDYTITRKRDGGVLNLDYRPQAGDSYYLRTLFSRFSDEEIRQRHNIEFADAQAVEALGETESSRELKARKETQDIRSLVLGLERRLGGWNLAVAGGVSSAGERTPTHIAAAKFVSGTTYTAGFSNPQRPTLLGADALNQASDYTLDSISLSDQTTRDRERNVRFDLERRVDFAGGSNELKFGGKISRRRKTSEMTVWDIDGGDFGNPTMSAFVGGNVDYAMGNFGPGLSAPALSGFVGDIDRNAYLDDEESRINDFTMHEDIDAAYVQNTYSTGLWRILGGLRYEGTRFRASGTGLDNGNFIASEHRHDYSDWLPSLHLRRDLDNDTSLRAAWSNALVRPTFGQLAPGYVIEGDEAEFGNPMLKPMKSANFDIGIEKRLGYAGAVSVYAFHKNIRDFVYNTDVAGTGAWADFAEAHTYANGSRARVSGLEFAFARAFDTLPSPWNGLLVSANATFSNGRARIEGPADGTAREIPLPSQSKRTFNLTLGYEKGPLGLRLAAVHKSRYLLEVADPGDAEQDQYVDAQTHYDFTARYTLDRRMQVVFEALNLSDEHYYVHAGAGNRSRNVQYESYGRSFRIGLKIATF